MAGYVYMIGSPTFRWYKIGKTSKPSIRLEDIGILLPFRVELIAIWKTDNYHNLEKDLHRRLVKQRINGEWFFLWEHEVRALCAGLLYLAITDLPFTFSNIPIDYAPDGKVLRWRGPKSKVVRPRRPLLPPEEHEKKKQAAIAARKAKRSLKFSIDKD